MEKVKRIIALLVSIAIFSSCTQNDLEPPARLEQRTYVESKGSMMPEIKLADKRLLTVDEIQEERNTVGIYGFCPAPYAESIPIYRYLYYGSYQNIDHYFGASKSSSLVVHGVTYSYEHHSFNIMPKNNYPDLIALYRHYSSAERDHILTTSSYIGSYTSDGIIGYVYMHPQVGTVPLLEYYSSKRKSHHYIVRNTEIDWMLTHDPDYVYVKTIGYVYPGSAIDEKKEATNFIINQGSESTNITFRLNVKVIEGERYWELVYEVEGPKKGTSITIPINNTYTVVSCVPVIIKSVYEQIVIDEITYPVTAFIYSGWSVKKIINNYNVKLEYSENFSY